MIRRHRRSTRRFAVLWLIPLLIISVGYAAYSQQLTLNGTSQKPAYSSANNLDISYNQSITTISGGYQYTLSPFTVLNNGTVATTSWQVTFTLPVSATNVVCTNANCTISGQTVTMTNALTNGVIAAGASTAVSLSFQTAVNNYVLQNIAITGTQNPIFQTIPGLTVNVVAGTRKKTGQKWNNPFTITVTNNSGQNLTALRLTVPWNTSINTVKTMPTTLTYVAGTSLVMTSTGGLANGQTATYSVVFVSTVKSWTVTSCLVEGQL